MTTEPRYPLDPLAKHLGITLGQIGGHQPGDPLTGHTALANRLRVTTRTIRRYQRHGINEHDADRYACHIGTHPSRIWPTWWTNTPDNLHGTAAHNAHKTHCPAGHTYDHTDNRGYRTCRTCRRNQLRKCRQNHKNPGQHTHFTQLFLPGTHT